jgi:hypothetical protein
VAANRVHLNLNGATLYGAPRSLTAVRFYQGGSVRSGTMDNVFVTFRTAATTEGGVYDCDFVNQTYGAVNIVRSCSNVRVERNRFHDHDTTGKWGRASYAAIEITKGARNIVVRDNVFANVRSGVVADGTDGEAGSEFIENILIEHNWFENLVTQAPRWTSAGASCSARIACRRPPSA